MNKRSLCHQARCHQAQHCNSVCRMCTAADLLSKWKHAMPMKSKGATEVIVDRVGRLVVCSCSALFTFWGRVFLFKYDVLFHRIFLILRPTSHTTMILVSFLPRLDTPQVSFWCEQVSVSPGSLGAPNPTESIYLSTLRHGRLLRSTKRMKRNRSRNRFCC